MLAIRIPVECVLIRVDRETLSEGHHMLFKVAVFNFLAATFFFSLWWEDAKCDRLVDEKARHIEDDLDSFDADTNCFLVGKQFDDVPRATLRWIISWCEKAAQIEMFCFRICASLIVLPEDLEIRL